jgi:hypothetical protein
MLIDYNVINYEIAGDMWSKVGSQYVQVCSQYLTIQLGSPVHFHFFCSAPWNHMWQSTNNKQAKTIAQCMHLTDGFSSSVTREKNC